MKTSRVHTSFITSIILAELTCMHVYIHKHGWLVQMEVWCLATFNSDSYTTTSVPLKTKANIKDISSIATLTNCARSIWTHGNGKNDLAYCVTSTYALHSGLRCLSWSSASVDVVSSSQLYHRAMLLSTSFSKLGTKRKATSLALMWQRKTWSGTFTMPVPLLHSLWFVTTPSLMCC